MISQSMNNYLYKFDLLLLPIERTNERRMMNPAWFQ